MKKLVLLVALLISVTGFSQIKEKEFFSRMKPTLHTRSIHQLQSFKDMDRKTQELYLQTLTKKTQTSADEPLDSPNVIKQCLDSIVYGGYKEIFTYDNRGFITLDESYWWDESENNWKGSMKNEYGHDNQGNNTLFISYGWDYDNNVWSISYKEEIVYDAHGNITEYVSYRWQDNVLAEKYKREATYNAAGNEIENIRYDWDFANNDWIKLYRGVSTFDGSGRVTEYIDYEWIGNEWIAYYKVENTYHDDGYVALFYDWIDNSWQLAAKEECTYDRYGNETLFVVSVWDGTDWMVMFQFKTDYEYDADGNLTLRIDYDYDEENSVWIAYTKTVFEYDASGNVTMSADYGWSEEINDWIGWSKYLYEYDALGNMTILTSYNWDWDNNDWEKSYKQECTYDAAGNMIVSLSYVWEDNAWVESDKVEDTFDLSYSRPQLVVPPDMYMNYKKLEEKRYFWDGTDWEEPNITVYYWSEVDIEESISEIVPQNRSIHIYPNPVSDILHIETENQDMVPDVKIYSMQGSLLLHSKGNQIDVSALPNGIYVVEANGVCMKVIKK